MHSAGWWAHHTSPWDATGHTHKTAPRLARSVTNRDSARPHQPPLAAKCFHKRPDRKTTRSRTPCVHWHQPWHSRGRRCLYRQEPYRSARAPLGQVPCIVPPSTARPLAGGPSAQTMSGAVCVVAVVHPAIMAKATRAGRNGKRMIEVQSDMAMKRPARPMRPTSPLPQPLTATLGGDPPALRGKPLSHCPSLALKAMNTRKNRKSRRCLT